jgi:transposase-like protein
MLKGAPGQSPRVINVDQNPAYPPAVAALKAEASLPEDCQLRQCKDLNNIVEQDHRFVKRRVNRVLIGNKAGFQGNSRERNQVGVAKSRELDI